MASTWNLRVAVNLIQGCRLCFHPIPQNMVSSIQRSVWKFISKVSTSVKYTLNLWQEWNSPRFVACVVPTFLEIRISDGILSITASKLVTTDGQQWWFYQNDRVNTKPLQDVLLLFNISHCHIVYAQQKHRISCKPALIMVLNGLALVGLKKGNTLQWRCSYRIWINKHIENHAQNQEKKNHADFQGSIFCYNP